MPQPLRDANLAPRWWPASATNTFVLFTMKDASMSYHIDLWATAVFYAVLWGIKIFMVMPCAMRCAMPCVEL
tara:strand:- start:13 stop:228 length:216 start_codon:yes stop_codon:yes gene_type:complete